MGFEKNIELVNHSVPFCHLKTKQLLMTDSHQPKPMNRSMTPKTPTVQPFKKGDIIWVVYRKSINWPAKVTAYYPKDKKVSYVFFPLKPKNAVFKTDPAKVQLFTLDDQLPDNAPIDLEESFEQARRFLQGVPEEEIIAENARKEEEAIAQMKPKKKPLTTADALKRATGTPKGTPKSQPKQPKSAAKEVKFKQGDPIIVDTPMGMWPGMFISYVKDDPPMVNYSLFPREEHSHEVMQTPVDAIIPFPPERIEQALEDGRTSNSEVLLAALQDVQKYMNEIGHTTSPVPPVGTTSMATMGTPLSSVAAQLTTTGIGRESVKEKKPKKQQPPKVELTPPRETKSLPRMSLNSRLSSRIGDDVDNESLPAVATPSVQKSKKRTASQMFHEPVEDLPAAGPMVKRRKEIGMDEADEETTANEEEEEEEDEYKIVPQKQANSLLNGGSAGANATANGKPRRLSEAERNREFAALGEKVEKVMREKQQKAMKDWEQQQYHHQQTTSSASLTPSPAKETPKMGKKSASEEAIPIAISMDKDKKVLSTYDLAQSTMCQQHVESHLIDLGQQWFQKQLVSEDDFHFEIRKVGLFTCKELESLFSIARKWFCDVVYQKFLPNERLPDLRELYLVSKHVLPEIGTFVLSQEKDCSFEEARRIYAEQFASSYVSADPNGTDQKQMHKQNDSASSNNNKSLSTLIEAAKMMEGGASSEEQ